MEIDDQTHKREEAKRRAARKAAKSKRTHAQREKDRKRKEHTQRVLNEANKNKKGRTSDGALGAANESKFEGLFSQRGQGFKIEFAFRNAPPRPPVGPCFVGLGLDGLIQDYSQYRPMNAVETNYSWKLHSEPDLGVPLAPSAMDLQCYEKPAPSAPKPVLAPEDDALLDWKGSMGDTAAEELQKLRDSARSAARLKGKKVSSTAAAKAVSHLPTVKKNERKKFSRVLNEKLPFYMKKTSYLSNDFGKRVHDFTSLAKTKEKEEEALEAQKRQMEQSRSASAISRSFASASKLVHPTKKKLKPVLDVPLLPNIKRWGDPHTHVVLDSAPKGYEESTLLTEAFVAHVEKKQATSRMTCQFMLPDKDRMADEDGMMYHTVSQYDLDVTPLKEDDEPHSNFCLIITDTEALYMPISSRVQLSMGRPRGGRRSCLFSRRDETSEEKSEKLDLIAEVDEDAAGGETGGFVSRRGASRGITEKVKMEDDDDDDDDDDEDDRFGANSNTIVAG